MITTLVQLYVEDAKRSSKQEHMFQTQILLVVVEVRRDLRLQFQERAVGDHWDHLALHEQRATSRFLVIWDSKDLGN